MIVFRDKAIMIIVVIKLFLVVHFISKNISFIGIILLYEGREAIDGRRNDKKLKYVEIDRYIIEIYIYRQMIETRHEGLVNEG